MKITRTINEQTLAAIFPADNTDPELKPIWNRRQAELYLAARGWKLDPGAYSSDYRGCRDIRFYFIG